MRRILIALLMLVPLTTAAQESVSSTGPLFMKDMLGGKEFFEPWGVGFDYFTMDQDYEIKSLNFDLPGFEVDDLSLIDVTNELQNYDLKVDVWITPFLNVFGLLGRINADTYVDLSAIPIDAAGNNLGTQTVPYSGTVYGGGFTLIYGTEKWFASVNNTWTGTNLGGDFDSSVSAYTAQPRIGLIRDKWTFYVGGMYLKTNEKHSGTIELNFPGTAPIPVPFDVELESQNKWNYSAGVFYVFSPKAHILLEYGFGNRNHTLFNFTYRF